jgi:uncharacterized protein YbjT (DUF2867 family)
VVGASGGTGAQLVEQSLARGWQVTAFVRDAKRLRRSDPRVQIAIGDVLEADSVDRAVRGHDAVLCALGHKRWFYPNRILSAGTQNLLDAMERHGVRRFICETSLGVGNSYGRLGLYYTVFVAPFILPFYYWDKARQEAAVRASGLEWTIVRPGVLTNGPKRGRYRVGDKVGNWIWSVRISRADVAHFMLDLVQAREQSGRTLAVAY